MTVGTQKNNVISSVTSARVFSVHLQHYRLTKSTVQSTDLTSVTTFFYEAQPNGVLAGGEISPFLARDRILVGYAFVYRDVLYPTAHRSPRHVDLAGNAPVSIAGVTQLDRLDILGCSVLVRTAHLYFLSYVVLAYKALCLLGYAPAGREYNNRLAAQETSEQQESSG